MLMKLHCNEFVSSELSSALDVSRAELQHADTELQSVNQQLTTHTEHCHQLQKQLHDAEEILRKQVGL